MSTQVVRARLYHYAPQVGQVQVSDGRHVRIWPRDATWRSANRQTRPHQLTGPSLTPFPFPPGRCIRQRATHRPLTRRNHPPQPPTVRPSVQSTSAEIALAAASVDQLDRPTSSEISLKSSSNGRRIARIRKIVPLGPLPQRTLPLATTTESVKMTR